MKLGLHYHKFRIPKWDAYYVDYNGICQIIRDLAIATSAADSVGRGEIIPKTHVSTQGNRTVAQLHVEATVLSQLDDDLSRFETFRLQVSASFLSRENEICRIFGFAEAPILLPNLDIVDELELQAVAASYESLVLELREIQWFDKVNHTAIGKLFDKLESISHDTAAIHRCRSRWVTLQQLLNKDWDKFFGRMSKLLDDIRKELAQPRRRTYSWCIASLVSHTLHVPATHDMLYECLKNDQHSLLQQHVFSVIVADALTRDELGPLIGKIFLVCILFSARETTALVLEIMMREQLSAEQVFLIVKMYGMELGRLLIQSHDGHMQYADNFGHAVINLLDSMGSKATDLLLQEKDCQGCLLLHHAAHYGLNSLCEVILSRIISIGPTAASETLLSADLFGRTPLHHAVHARNLPVLTLLLQALSEASHDKHLTARVKDTLGSILILALRAGAKDIAKLVLQHGPDLQYRSSRGETALYCAVQSGNLSLVQLLISQLSRYEVSLDIAEATRGWTPLIVACANGQPLIAKLLVQAGAKQNLCDARGWTALEHAVLRGHHGIAELFKPFQPTCGLEGPASAVRTVQKTSQAICRAGERVFVIHLGSTQSGHDQPAIQLNDYNSTLRQECPLELEVSILGRPSEVKTMPLPLLDDQLHYPLIFRLENGLSLQIVLKVFWCRDANTRVLVSIGTSILDQDSLLGNSHESLIRECTISMMDLEKLNPSGAVLLSYLVAKPFSGLEKACASSFATLEDGSVRLVGHRGLGQNVSSQSFLQLGENTVMSFLSAAQLGASFVEFDLQVTRDLEAVIYHDYSLSESGTDIPIHEVTLTQYKYASEANESLSLDFCNIDKSLSEGEGKLRSWSSGEESAAKAAQLRKTLQHTVDFQAKGFKPNSRGDVVQDTLATLEELLVSLPQDIGFNIEIKYPRLHEARAAGIAPVALNINTFVDVALEKLRKLAGERPIILSSFTPEVCILLAIKQAAYPVMLITNAGKPPVQDRELRGSSLQAAVHFARMWNLAGVVLACETFLYCPRLIQFVKNMGLTCASYGLLNNEPKNCRVQVDAGVDILMVDRVKLVADDLKQYAASKNDCATEGKQENSF